MPKTPGERVGQLAAEAIELIEERYGEGTTVGAVAIICDVITGGEAVVNPIIILCSDPRRWVQVALLSEALEGAERCNEMRGEQADDHERMLNGEDEEE